MSLPGRIASPDREEKDLIKGMLKRKAHALVDLFPWGRDLYQRYWVYPRSDDQLDGVYGDFDAAMTAAGGAERAAYDHNNAKKSIEKESRIVDRYFQSSDYPALFWLSRALADEHEVLELGGSVGYAYYSFRRMLDYPERLRWTIVELPEAVRLGREIAAARGEVQVTFAETIEESIRYGIFLTAGTLQYMQEHVVEIIGRCKEPPRHLIINRLPAYDGEEYWTVQNLGINKVPYRIYSRPKLIESIQNLGYHLRDAWHKPRTMIIPFAPARTVSSYQGFYFERSRSGD